MEAKLSKRIYTPRFILLILGLAVAYALLLYFRDFSFVLR